MNEKILIVDDEANVLDGLQNLLRKEFTVRTALGGETALQLLANDGPFAVIVTDMRMPSMDGVTLLKKVRTIVPDSVRLMLTGNSDLQTAIDAVNDRAIFRFLSKPCSPEVLKSALTAALHQYRLITAERELLEKTLHGSVKVLIEILALVNPAAFSRANRVHRTVQSILQQLHPPESWSYEIAALLSQIGCVALGSETVEAVYSGAELSIAEFERFKMHPTIAYDFLKKIPRLETVSTMILGQLGTLSAAALLAKNVNQAAAKLGSEILLAAIDFDQLCLTGISREDALGEIRKRGGKYNPDVLAALKKVPSEPVHLVCKEISVRELTVGMMLDEDLRAPNGLLLVARGQEVGYPLLVRIRNFSQKTPITHRFRVKVDYGEENAPKDDVEPVTTPASH